MIYGNTQNLFMQLIQSSNLISFLVVLSLIMIYAILRYRRIDINMQPLDKDKVLPSRGILALLDVLHHFFKIIFFPPGAVCADRSNGRRRIFHDVWIWSFLFLL